MKILQVIVSIWIAVLLGSAALSSLCKIADYGWLSNIFYDVVGVCIAVFAVGLGVYSIMLIFGKKSHGAGHIQRPWDNKFGNN